MLRCVNNDKRTKIKIWECNYMWLFHIFFCSECLLYFSHDQVFVEPIKNSSVYDPQNPWFKYIDKIRIKTSVVWQKNKLKPTDQTLYFMAVR